jgi:hypothetical protein
MILLRILAGLAAGIASGAAGLLLLSLTSSWLLFYLPPALLLATAIFIALRFRRFGYITGILLAPLLVGITLFLLLLIICSPGFGLR